MGTIPVQPSGYAWFDGIEGERPDAIDAATYTSLARYARQNYACDISPRVTEYVVLPVANRWGDDVLATVQYDADGALTSLGGHLEGGRLVWTCYAD